MKIGIDMHVPGIASLAIAFAAMVSLAPANAQTMFDLWERYEDCWNRAIVQSVLEQDRPTFGLARIEADHVCRDEERAAKNAYGHSYLSVFYSSKREMENEMLLRLTGRLP